MAKSRRSGYITASQIQTGDVLSCGTVRYHQVMPDSGNVGVITEKNDKLIFQANETLYRVRAAVWAPPSMHREGKVKIRRPLAVRV